MSSISLFDVISAVFPDPNIVLCIPASAADAAAINPEGIKTLFANGFLLMVILFLVMDLVIYQEILLIVSSLITEFLIT